MSSDDMKPDPKPEHEQIEPRPGQIRHNLSIERVKAKKELADRDKERASRWKHGDRHDEHMGPAREGEMKEALRPHGLTVREVPDSQRNTWRIVRMGDES